MNNKILQFLILSVIFGLLLWLIFTIPDNLRWLRLWLSPIHFAIFPWLIIKTITTLDKRELNLKSKILSILGITNLGLIIYLIIRIIINKEYSLLEDKASLIELVKILLLMNNLFVIFSLFFQMLITGILMKNKEISR